MVPNLASKLRVRNGFLEDRKKYRTVLLPLDDTNKSLDHAGHSKRDI
jgi:hypothetical protein